MGICWSVLFLLFAVCVSGCAYLIKPVAKPFRSAVRLAIQLHEKERQIFSTRYFMVELKKHHMRTGPPGSATIRLKRVEEKLGFLTDEEWLELKYVIGALEYASMHAFGDERPNLYMEFSVKCLMNHAMRQWFKPELVHLHFHPRKREKTIVGDYEFPADDNFGNALNLYDTRNIPEQVQKEIIRLMQEKVKEFAKMYKISITLPDGTVHQ